MQNTSTKTNLIIRIASAVLATVIITGTGIAAIAAYPQTIVVAAEPAQELTVSAIAEPQTVVRDSYAVTEAPPEPEVVVAEVPHADADPGTAQAIAFGMMANYGWGQGEFDCLVALWNRESGWNANAYNASSGAGGIPQALPASKMASAGADWATNPATQITWGLSYITGRYGTPCGAWTASETQGWY